MARISHSFTMGVAPAQAEAMFVRDIAPELHRDRGFSLERQAPGRLVFSDGVVDPGQVFDAEEAATEETDADARSADAPSLVADSEAPPTTKAATLRPSRGANMPVAKSRFYGALRRLTGRQINVDFEAEPTGTRVTLSGSAQRDIRDALSRLGQPGHWPATADEPHD